MAVTKFKSQNPNIGCRVYDHRPPTADRRLSAVVGLPSVVDILRFVLELLYT
jgi:hypothetical protein